MIFSGSSRFFKRSFAVALATRVKRSNRFICRLVEVMLAVGTPAAKKARRLVPRKALLLLLLLLGVKAVVDKGTRASVSANVATGSPTIVLTKSESKNE